MHLTNHQAEMSLKQLLMSGKYLHCNKRANVQRDILKNNRLTDAEKEVLKNKALFEVQCIGKEMDDTQNLTVNDVNE